MVPDFFTRYGSDTFGVNHWAYCIGLSVLSAFSDRKLSTSLKADFICSFRLRKTHYINFYSPKNGRNTETQQYKHKYKQNESNDQVFSKLHFELKYKHNILYIFLYSPSWYNINNNNSRGLNYKHLNYGISERDKMRLCVSRIASIRHVFHYRMRGVAE